MTTAIAGLSRHENAEASPAVSQPRDGLTDRRVVITAIALGGSIVAGMALNIVPLTTAGAFAAIAISLVAPAIGLAVLAFTAPLQPPLVVPAPGFNAILVGAIALGCIYRLPIDKPRIRLTAPAVLISGFVLYVAAWQVPDLATGYTGDVSRLVGYLFVQLLTGFGAIFAAGYVLSRRSPYPFLGAGLAAAVLASILGLVSFANPEVGPPVVGLLAQSDIDQRAVGPFYNPNYYGVFEAIAVVASIGLLLGARSKRVRWLLLGTAVIAAAAVLVSFSRGGLTAMAAGLACLALARYRGRTAIAVAVGLVAGAVLFYPILVEWRLNTLYGSASGAAYMALSQSDEGRLGAIAAGAQLFLSSPLLGIGPRFAEAAGEIIGTPIAAHNWYINTLVEYGMVGIVLWGLFLGALVFALRSRPMLPRSIGFGVLAAYAAGSMFLEPPASFQTSALPILVLVAAVTSSWGASGGDAQAAAQSGIVRPPELDTKPPPGFDQLGHQRVVVGEPPAH